MCCPPSSLCWSWLRVAVVFQLILARFRDRDAERLAVARSRTGGRGGRGARRRTDRFRSKSRHPALAVDSEHLGLGLACEHHQVHPGHRPGVADAHGRTAQCRDARRAVLPVHVPRARRVAVPTHRGGSHHRLHVELARRCDLAVPGQCCGAHVAPAPKPGRSMAHGRRRCDRRRASASFTAVPYVEFDTASMPNLAAFGVAVPTMLLVCSTVQHRDRIPLAILALVGVFSVHITGGVVAGVRRRLVVVRPALASGPGPGDRLGEPLLLVAVPTVLSCSYPSSSASCSRPRSSSDTRSSLTRARRRRCSTPSSSTRDTSTTSRSRTCSSRWPPWVACSCWFAGSGGRAWSGWFWWCRSCTRRRRSAARSARSPARSATCSTATRDGSPPW